jgi:DNA-binding YbaB/EbfC family protein
MPQPPNMNQMLKQVQQMQEEMAKAQEELKNERVEATSGGGTVKVVMTGELQVIEVVIAPGAVDPDDVELLQDLVLAAFNEALRSAQELQQRKLGAATGGLGDLAGGLGLPGL